VRGVVGHFWVCACASVLCRARIISSIRHKTDGLSDFAGKLCAQFFNHYLEFSP
jgi:hypothetical protein